VTFPPASFRMSRQSRGRSLFPRRRPILCALALSAVLTRVVPARRQQQPPPGFTEKVEVNVRTILAIVTDTKGEADRELSVEEVEMLEDGIPAKVLGVDVVRPVKTAGSDVGKEIPKTKDSLSAPPPEVLARMQQILYLDASLLQKQSVKKVCEMTAKNLEPLLARGPLLARSPIKGL
jgi:hypothetical protein